MNQPTAIFLVDLKARAKSLQPALAAMGFEVGQGPSEELSTAFDIAIPGAIIAPLASGETIVAALRAKGAAAKNLPLFLLSADGEPSKRPAALPPEVTAILPENIDGGVLGLRLRAVIPSNRRHERQATLVGLTPGALASTSTPPATPSESVPPRSVASPPSAVPSQAAIATNPSTGGSPVPATQPTPTPTASPAPTSAPSVPETAPVASASPVAFSVPPQEAPPSPSSPSKAKGVALGLAGAALVAAGAFFALKGGEEQLTPEAASAARTEAKTATKPAIPRAQEPEKAKPIPDAPSPPSEKSLPSAEPAAAEAAAEAEAEVEVDTPSTATAPDEPLSHLYKVASPITLPTCEEMLSKTAKDFETTVKWKAAHAWKLARKNLMAGKQNLAAQKMCESAFIDPSGPAIAGLVNHYLGQRALEQAHTWAKRGVEHNPKSRAAKESLGDVLIQMGRVKEARTLWLETLKLTDEDTGRLQKVATTLIRSANKVRRGGDSALAERIFRRALVFKDDDSVANAQFASLLLKNEQKGLAERWAKLALKGDPDSKIAQSVMDQLG